MKLETKLQAAALLGTVRRSSLAAVRVKELPASCDLT